MFPLVCKDTQKPLNFMLPTSFLRLFGLIVWIFGAKQLPLHPQTTPYVGGSGF